ncbi:uncharacterized protein LOC115999430 [Ipomoea triloba]|uniref:uncharacterized protein LOC115999430 n=1 Tax=Ipomoea triloba TaxID=35885 RepID=UPI00125D34BB|nr:uncharacterized protein LOC115999430 [Ipomoea triloba]
MSKDKEIDDSVIPYNLLPFPQRLWKSKESERESKFHKMLDKLEISMPFVEAKLPPKLKDPGSFAIPCIIGGFVVGGALCDLGASVSLMPYSMCKRLNLGEPKPTTMTLQMADHSVKRLVGVLEDIPEDAKVPIILGRPFLATAGAIIDVKRGKLVMEVAKNKIKFDIFKMAKHQPSYVDECKMVKAMEESIEETQKNNQGDMIDIRANFKPHEKNQALKIGGNFFGPNGFYKR